MSVFSVSTRTTLWNRKEEEAGRDGEKGFMEAQWTECMGETVSHGGNVCDDENNVLSHGGTRYENGSRLPHSERDILTPKHTCSCTTHAIVRATTTFIHSFWT